VWGEHRARALLEAHGIPLVPASLATSAAEAAELAASFAQPVAMKIASDEVAHKSDVGGVRLEVEPAQAATAFSELAAALAEHRPGSILTGVLVGPMRRGGMELLVGVVTDPDWGKVLSVGLGGLWVELLDDVSLRLLPVDEVDVADMLAELRSAALLTGVRGSTPADIDRLCQVIARIASLAEGLGSALDTLEVNPLRVEGADIEVLDALIVWKGGQL
jgi:succinyl-CoA synthetase beta subunit